MLQDANNYVLDVAPRLENNLHQDLGKKKKKSKNKILKNKKKRLWTKSGLENN